MGIRLLKTSLAMQVIMNLSFREEMWFSNCIPCRPVVPWLLRAAA